MKFGVFLIFFLLTLSSAQAFESLSYSGRLVNANGSPVTGPADLTFDLAYSGSPGITLCSQSASGVDLTHGVFHVKLNFPSCSPSLATILANTPANETVSIRVTDRTPDPDKIYSYQAIHSVPYAFLSQMTKQLVQMGAVDGQVLTWSGGRWTPTTPASSTGGTVTSITASDGLSGGVITNTGVIGISDGGVTSLKLADGTIVDADVSPTASIAQSKIQNLATDLAAKEPAIGLGLSTDYLDGDKAWRDFNQSVRNTLLLGYGVITTPGGIAASDTVLEALGKLEGQITANDTAFDNAGQWSKDGSLIYYNSGNVGIGTTTPADKLEVIGDASVSGKVRLKNSSVSYVELQAPASAGAITYTLPGTLGTSGQVLTTDNSGILSWTTPTLGSSQITDGSIVDADISTSANIAQSKIAGLSTTFGTKQDVIPLSDSTTFYRGDKTWQTLNTDAVPEGTRLYFTESKVLGTDLAGLTPAAGTISASDSILSAMNKLIGNQVDFVMLDGSEAMTGSLDLGTNKSINLAEPTASQDAATKNYVDGKASQWTTSGSNIYFNSGNVGVGTITPGEKLSVVGSASVTGKLRLKSDTANFVEFIAPLSLGSTQTYTLPSNTGSAGFALTTNGSGVLSWSEVATTSTAISGDITGTLSNAQISAGAITNADIANTTITYGKLNIADGAIPVAKVTGLDTLVVPENGNRYFTEARVRATQLDGYLVGSADPIIFTDTLLGAFGKLQAQISANKTSIDSKWAKNGSDLNYTSGNIGIGTTTPSASLDISNTGGESIILRDNNNVAADDAFVSYIRSKDSAGAPVWYVGEGSSSSKLIYLMSYQPGYSLALGTNAAGRLTITDTGNVGVGTHLPSAPLHVSKDDGLAAGEHWLFRAEHPTHGGVVIGYEANGTSFTASKVRASGGSPLVLGTSSNQNALTINDNGSADYRGRPITRYNPTMSFQVGDHDWTDMINTSNVDGTYAYSEAQKGVVMTGSSMIILKIRMPIDPKGVYRANVRARKIDGTGGFYVGASSLNANYSDIKTDLANSYNYFAANSVIIAAGSTYTASGIISGINATTDTNRNRFDPGAKYFDLVILSNYSGSGNTVIESVEVFKEPSGEPWKLASFQNSWSDYGSGYSPVGYQRDGTGTVHLRGLVQGGSVGSTYCIFTLPEGYRPEYRQLLQAQTYPNATPARIDVAPTGCVSPMTGNNTWISLDGLHFKAIP